MLGGAGEGVEGRGEEGKREWAREKKGQSKDVRYYGH